jgi:NTE family protein
MNSRCSLRTTSQCADAAMTKTLISHLEIPSLLPFMQKILYLFLLLILHSLLSLPSFSQPKYENLVFEGGGVKGIAYSGVLKELEHAGILKDIQKTAGTSAGSVTALMVSLGYTADEIYQIISETKFQKLNDGQFLFIGGFARLNRNFGWYKGNATTKWLEQIIKNKTGDPDITFRQLRDKGFKQLYVTATCLNQQRLLILSEETYPQMKVKDAVRISMTIPIYFGAVFIDSVGNVYQNNRMNKDLDIVVDGGITGNFPIFIFDSVTVDSANREKRIPNFKTLGVRIDSDAQIENDLLNQKLVPMDIYKMSDYMKAFYTIVIENLNRSQLIPGDWSRTISVSSVGIGPRIKRLTDEQKQALISSGEKHAREFLKRR